MAYLFKRGKRYYIKYYIGGKQKQKSLGTDSYQVARELQRRCESELAQGGEHPLPTRSPIPGVLQAYVDHIRAVKTPKSAQTDVYYLREAFGPCCEALTITSRKPSAKARKKKSQSKTDRRWNLPIIEASCFEAITTAQIAAFIDFKVRDQGLKPKTANHYRSILRRLFNWASEQHSIRLPNHTNPAAKVRPHKEQAPTIRFLTLSQIDEQLHALRFKPKLQTMVAVLIYAGLRREELTWLTLDDVDLSRKRGGHGTIRVRAKTIAGEYWQPKTRKNRAVPISRTLRDYLDRYTPPKSTITTSGGGGGGWFFPAPSGGRWDADNFSADLRAANNEAGLVWSCLDYRHTFGSQLAQKGVSLYKIATLMGNSPEICRRHYAALIPEALVDEVEFTTPDNRVSHLTG